ncbi:glycosyltransferase, partial [Fulvivirga aurantia]|uniref:glycosyltransferase n=1 Tax=Fulvivirga aurantia TaxID=2529383 RepID=UPI001CA3F282
MCQLGAVKKYIKKHNIQLIHAHLPWAGFLARVIHRHIRIPVIYTEHNKQERYHRITFWLNKLTFGWQNMAVAVSNDVEVSIRKNIGAKTT